MKKSDLLSQVFLFFFGKIFLKALSKKTKKHKKEKKSLQFVGKSL